ncbi:hypothetical protein ACFU9O_13760 [Streptomyces albidoflavus]|uniref:hypothetical protein n=1 Tax=Streptomyces sp. PLM4 TaxID=2929798 RepID=UPI0020C0789D|nr:hypothetical protein [Streptomyces sp. PLM4]
MNRRTLPALTALATATTLLLTACGGESPEADEKIPGAGESSAEASASAGEKGDDGIDRPEIEFPDDFKMTFEEVKGTDADGAAASADAENFMKSIQHAIFEGDPESAVYKFYIDPMSEAHEYAKFQVTQYVEHGWVLTGELRQSNVKVSEPKTEGVRVVSFCSDESKAAGKEAKTGKKVPDKDFGSPYISFEVLMKQAKSQKGLWRASKVKTERGGSQCAG